jgi:hypothetical protein
VSPTRDRECCIGVRAAAAAEDGRDTEIERILMCWEEARASVTCPRELACFPLSRFTSHLTSSSPAFSRDDKSAAQGGVGAARCTNAPLTMH